MKLSSNSLSTLQNILGGDDRIGALDASVSAVRAASDLVGRGKGGLILSRAAALASLGSAVWRLSAFVVSAARTRPYTVRIPETDPVFEIAEKWLNEVIPDDQKVSLLVRSRDVGGSTDDGQSRREIRVGFDGTLEQDVVLFGHSVTVVAKAEESGDSSRARSSSEANQRSIMFSFNTREARDDVMSHLRTATTSLRRGGPRMYSANSYGYFRNIGPVPQRDIGSVVLKDGQMERIVDNLKTFLANEESYVKIGMPYHTGMLLHGAPGSGKSSTARAVATTLGLSVYIVQLSVLEDDDALTRIADTIPPYSVLVLEDVDVYHQTHARTDDDDSDTGKGITLAGLLNLLDGFTTPNGLITIMTSNHPDKLDPALKRPGRIDITEELGALDEHQLRRLCVHLMGKELPDSVRLYDDAKIMPAEITGIVRKYLPNTADAFGEVASYVVLAQDPDLQTL